MEGGFREDETADFGDLLNSTSSTAFGATSTYPAFGAPQDDDLATNPFADLASSSAQLPYEPEERAQSPFYSAPIASPPVQTTYDAPAYASPPTPIFTPTEDVFAPSFDPAPSSYDPAPTSYEQQSSAYESSPFVPAPYEAQPYAGAPSAHDAEPDAFEPSTPVGTTNAFPDRTFVRAAAPEPETPAQPQLQPGDPDGFSYTYSRASPSAARHRSPSSPTSATPLETESPFEAQSTRRGKADLSALLGDEKPSTLSGFKKADRADGAAGPLGSKIAVLPAKSVGKKPVARPLAALLGLETEEDEPRKARATPAAKRTGGFSAAGAQAASGSAASQQEAAAAEPRMDEVDAPQDGAGRAHPQEAAPSAAAEPTATAPEPEEPVVAEPAPLPPVDVAVEPPVPSALETPLPPSRAATPPQAQAPSSSALDDKKPTLSRAASAATSAVSVDSAHDTPYDTMVSPLETGTTPGREGSASGSEAWPGNKQVEALDQQLASLAVDDTPTPTTAPAPTSSDPEPASYSQYIFGEGTSAPVESDGTSGPPSSEPPASRGFRAFNGSSEDGGFGATDDADSLRGTYSRSVEVGDGEDAETETGVSTPATERTVGMGEQQRSEREGSAPLPPLPASSPTIQGSPRSTQLGGSLGPTFIITVGDPQTVGSALNPAAQHTVYTVRTRTTSSAYRKPDFAVLRRFSHFLWLYDALTQNNPGVIVPGMPEKHAIGRFGSEFVENRRLGLESALNKIVSHPMLVGDPDLRLFLESDTFHIDIKQRKIDTTAEHKGFLANLSSSISGPKFTEFDDYFDQRRQQLEAFETQLRTLLDSLAKAAKARHALQGSVAELQSAFLALAQCDLSSSLRKLLNEAASVQKKLYDLAEAQAADEEKIDGLTTVAETYARLCTSARGVFGARIKAYHTWQGAEANVRKMQSAHEKAKRSGRTHSELLNLSVAEIADAERKMLDARHDFDDVSKLTKAEMARFDKEKVDDFKKALEDFADSLAARQRIVVATWQEYHDLLAAAVETNKAAERRRILARGFLLPAARPRAPLDAPPLSSPVDDGQAQAGRRRLCTKGGERSFEPGGVASRSLQGRFTSSSSAGAGHGRVPPVPHPQERVQLDRACVRRVPAQGRVGQLLVPGVAVDRQPGGLAVTPAQAQARPPRGAHDPRLGRLGTVPRLDLARTARTTSRFFRARRRPASTLGTRQLRWRRSGPGGRHAHAAHPRRQRDPRPRRAQPRRSILVGYPAPHRRRGSSAAPVLQPADTRLAPRLDLARGVRPHRHGRRPHARTGAALPLGLLRHRQRALPPRPPADLPRSVRHVLAHARCPRAGLARDVPHRVRPRAHALARPVRGQGQRRRPGRRRQGAPGKDLGRRRPASPRRRRRARLAHGREHPGLLPPPSVVDGRGRPVPRGDPLAHGQRRLGPVRPAAQPRPARGRPAPSRGRGQHAPAPVLDPLLVRVRRAPDARQGVAALRRERDLGRLSDRLGRRRARRGRAHLDGARSGRDAQPPRQQGAHVAQGYLARRGLAHPRRPRRLPQRARRQRLRRRPRPVLVPPPAPSRSEGRLHDRGAGSSRRSASRQPLRVDRLGGHGGRRSRALHPPAHPRCGCLHGRRPQRATFRLRRRRTKPPPAPRAPPLCARAPARAQGHAHGAPRRRHRRAPRPSRTAVREHPLRPCVHGRVDVRVQPRIVVRAADAVNRWTCARGICLFFPRYGSVPPLAPLLRRAARPAVAAGRDGVGPAHDAHGPALEHRAAALPPVSPRPLPLHDRRTSCLVDQGPHAPHPLALDRRCRHAVSVRRRLLVEPAVLASVPSLSLYPFCRSPSSSF